MRATLRKVVDVFAVAIFLGVVLTGSTIAQPTRGQSRLAPLTNMNSKSRISGQYIVVFKPDTSRDVVVAAREKAKALGGTVRYTYASALLGFSLTVPKDTTRGNRALQTLRESQGVAYIEADQQGSIDTMQPPNPPGAPPSGLDRIDRRLLPLDNTYTYSETGAGVHAYVLDTGIRITHTEFGGRATGAFTAIMDGNGTNDCHGHGTHVAGTIGGATFGVAKGVALHAVRVASCTGGVLTTDAIAGVDWVTTNAMHPAVANMSLHVAASSALDTAVSNSIASGVTYAVSAANLNADACTVSPARVPEAITVGSTDPATDARAATSDFGTCVDLFAPGVGILSADNASDTATRVRSGTSMATPHVAGTAARHLQNFPLDLPAAVWARIHANDDVFGTTMGWPGVTSPGAGSPNELLHVGSLNDGHDDGDPHLTTVQGIPYDFQGAGEYVALRDRNGLQVQTRQVPITTAPPIPNAYTGLTTCVSLNTAVAARVGAHRVTYEPNLRDAADASGLQLRVDGVLTTLAAQGVTLGVGGRVITSAGNGIEIDFPDGTALVATPNFWGAPHNMWYLNVSVFHSSAEDGLMGALAAGSWLPALPNGTSLGPKPGALHQRFVELYRQFGNAWRVTNATSLFDYAPGTSTATYTLASWPPENPPCVVKDSPPAKPVGGNTAEKLCQEVVDKNRHVNCVFDVAVTGEPGFAKLYAISERIENGATRTAVFDDKSPTRSGEPVTFTATVARHASRGRRAPTGTVQFSVDGSTAGDAVKLDERGRATWTTSALEPGRHRVAAGYTPSEGSVFLPSNSFDKVHLVTKEAVRSR